jgi:hypothetical protein
MEADNLETPVMVAWVMAPRWKEHDLVYDLVGEVGQREARFGEVYQIDFVAGIAHTAQGPVILQKRFPTPRQGQISG